MFPIEVAILYKKLLYLDPGLRESYTDGEVFPHEDVRVVCLPERPLHFVQLSRSKTSSVTLLFDGGCLSTLAGYVE